jgi:iron complex outermembrane receptor protein
VVTAQRREERLQDVPVAVSQFTTRDRDRLGLNSIQEIIAFTPGASFQDYPNRLTIRGVGRLTNALGSDPGVAVYQDGVYTSETAPVGQFPIFIDRVEILRGPQGTLYGRNSIGGSVNVLSRRPTDSLQVEGRLTIGNYRLVQPALTVSGPLSDRVRVRVGGVYDYQGEGFIRNVGANGGSLGERRDYYVEGQIEADIGATGELWLKYNHANWDRSGLAVVQQSAFLTDSYFPANSLLPSPTFGLATPNPSVSTLRETLVDDIGRVRLRDNHAVTANLSFALGSATLRYVGGFQTYEYSSVSDNDRTDRASFQFFGQTIGSRQVERIGENKTQHSHELTLTSAGGEAFNWLGGLFYYHEDLEQPVSLASPEQPQLALPLRAPTFAPAAPNPDRLYYSQLGTLTSESFALFGQGDVRLTETVRLTAGLRWSRDRKTGTEDFRLLFFEPFSLGPLGACCSLDVTPPVSTRTLRNSWSGVNGRLALDWQPDPDTLFYVSVANGWKSGGFNLGQVAPNAEVDPETLWAFEVGSKLVRGPLTLNAAAFYYAYRDLQVITNVVRNGVLLQDFVNADRARSLGLELEATWTPVEPLQFNLAYSWLDAEFTRFCCFVDVAGADPTALLDLAGNALPQAPRHRVALAGRYSVDIPSGALIFGGNVAHTAAQFYAPFDNDRYRAPAFTIVDLRLTYQGKDNPLTLIAFAKNLFDEQAINGVALGAFGAGLPRVVVPGAPRTMGLEVQVRF